MSALVFDRRHWRAAQERRTQREAVVMRKVYAGRPERRRPSLDDILGPAFDPTVGSA